MFFDPAIAYMSAAIDLHATKTTLGLIDMQIADTLANESLCVFNRFFL